MPYKDKETQRLAMQKIHREWKLKQRIAGKAAKERITSFLKMIGEFDGVKSSSGDGFVLLKEWLLPKFFVELQSLAYHMTDDWEKTGDKPEEVKRKNYLNFNDMVLYLEQGLRRNVHDVPKQLALGLCHVNGVFLLVARWIMDLSDFVESPGPFNSFQESESLKVLVEAIKAKQRLPPVHQPGLEAIALLEMKRERGIEYSEKQKLEMKVDGTKTE